MSPGCTPCRAAQTYAHAAVDVRRVAWASFPPCWMLPPEIVAVQKTGQHLSSTSSRPSCAQPPSCADPGACARWCACAGHAPAGCGGAARSEEHTSELQSHVNL